MVPVFEVHTDRRHIFCIYSTTHADAQSPTNAYISVGFTMAGTHTPNITHRSVGITWAAANMHHAHCRRYLMRPPYNDTYLIEIERNPLMQLDQALEARRYFLYCVMAIGDKCCFPLKYQLVHYTVWPPKTN